MTDHPNLPQKTFWGVWANLIIGGILSRLRRWDNTNPCTKLRYFYGVPKVHQLLSEAIWGLMGSTKGLFCSIKGNLPQRGDQQIGIGARRRNIVAEDGS